MVELDDLNKKFQKEILSGVSSLVLLHVINSSKKSMYGYQIAKLLETGEKESPIKKGALYPVLRSMEKQGLLSSEVEPSVSGPPRRYYSITPTGKETLVVWKKTWAETQQFVNSIIEK